MGPATGSLAPTPIQPPRHPTTGAAIMTAKSSTETLATAAAATALRDQLVADSTTVAGIQAHAIPISAGATEDEVTQAAQAAVGAALTSPQAAIAGAESTPPHRMRRRGPRHQHQDRAAFFFSFLLFLNILTHQSFVHDTPYTIQARRVPQEEHPGRRRHKRRSIEAEGV